MELSKDVTDFKRHMYQPTHYVGYTPKMKMLLVKTNEFANLNKVTPTFVKFKKVVLQNGKFEEKEFKLTQDQHYEE